MAYLPRQLRWLDLRFPAEEEERFARHWARHLVKALGCGSVGVLGICSWLVVKIAKDELVYSGVVHSGPRTVMFSIICFLGLWHSVVVAIALRELLQGRQGATKRLSLSIDWELLALLTFSMDCCMAMISNKATLSSLFDVAPEDAFLTPPTEAPTNVLLLVLFCISLLGSFCPIRWHRLWYMLVFVWLLLLFIHVVTRLFGQAVIPIYVSGSIIFCQLCMSWQMESSRRASWRMIADLKGHEEELERRYSIATQLLSSFCDCVLQVDEDMRLLEPCPRLAAILLRSPTSAGLGASVGDFMARGEFDRFQAHLQRRSLVNTAAFDDTCVLSSGSAMATSPSTSCMPGSMTLELLDSVSTRVSVHLYFASLRKDGSLQHMVGVVETPLPGEQDEFCRGVSSAEGTWSSFMPRSISEGSDTGLLQLQKEAARAQQAQQQQAQQAQQLPPAQKLSRQNLQRLQQQHQPRGSGADADDPSEDGTLSDALLSECEVVHAETHELMTSEEPGAEKTQALLVQIKLRHDMEILEANDAFLALFPASAGGGAAGAPQKSFASYVEKSEDLRRWLLDQAELFRSGAVQAPCLLDFGLVRLRLPNGAEGVVAEPIGDLSPASSAAFKWLALTASAPESPPFRAGGSAGHQRSEAGTVSHSSRGFGGGAPSEVSLRLSAPTSRRARKALAVMLREQAEATFCFDSILPGSANGAQDIAL